MLPGFLPMARNSTFMMDVVVVAMVAVLPVLTWSLWLIKARQDYRNHKRVQLGLGIVLLIAVILFEVEIRLVGGWRVLAKDSPFLGGWLETELMIHLFFAISTTVLWLITIPLALRRFPSPPVPGSHSRLHKRLGWVSALFMYASAVTGWLFYWMAFVAR